MGESDSKSDDLEFKLKAPTLKKVKIEWILFIVFFIAFLYFLSAFDDGRLIHEDGPYNFAAGDMFVFVAFADINKFENDITKQPPYMAAGVDDAVNYFSLQGGIIAAQLSKFIGAESYDFIIHLNLLFIVLATLIIFQFLSKIDIRLAILSLPLSLLVFKWPFQYTITWGMHISNINLIFVTTSLLALYYLDKKYIWIALGIMNGAGVLAHAREMLMFNIGVAIYFLFRVLKEKIPQEIIKNPGSIKTLLKENKTAISLKHYIFSIPITLIFMFRHLPVMEVFKASTTATSKYNPIIDWAPPTLSHHVYFPQFGFYQYLIFIGVAIALYFLIFKKNRLIDIIAAFAISFLLHGFFSILSNKTTQIRHLFPVLLIPLIGIAMYFIYNSVKKHFKTKANLIFVVLFLLLLIPTVSNHAPAKARDYSFSDPFTWDGMKWITNNTDPQARILVLYGDRHTQETMFMLFRRVYAFVPQEEYFSKISSGVISSNYETRKGFVHMYARQHSFGEVEIVPPISVRVENETLCDYDYVFSDKLSQNPTIQAYTLTVLNKLITESNLTLVYENDLVAVLRNPDVGGSCFKDEVIR